MSVIYCKRCGGRVLMDVWEKELQCIICGRGLEYVTAPPSTPEERPRVGVYYGKAKRQGSAPNLFPSKSKFTTYRS